MISERVYTAITLLAEVGSYRAEPIPVTE